MKKILVLVLVLIALFAGWLLLQDKTVINDSVNIDEEAILDEGMPQDDIIVDTMMPEPMVLDEDGESITEDMEAINTELLERLQSQSTLGLDGDELTDEDIQLIQEIIDAVTNSVQ
jgi:regulatory protein YycI of two-component signal transduction system YycFG